MWNTHRAFYDFDRRMLSSTRVVIIYVELKKMSVVRRLNTFAKEKQIVIDDIELETSDNAKMSRMAAVIFLRLPTKSSHTDLIEQINDLEGVMYVEEI